MLQNNVQIFTSSPLSSHRQIIKVEWRWRQWKDSIERNGSNLAPDAKTFMDSDWAIPNSHIVLYYWTKKSILFQPFTCFDSKIQVFFLLLFCFPFQIVWAVSMLGFRNEGLKMVKLCLKIPLKIQINKYHYFDHL